MTLSFSTQIDGKPTYFINKISFGLFLIGMKNDIAEYAKKYFDKFGKDADSNENPTPKIHTIRLDKSDRWKAGNKIHFVINNRTKNRFQFAPVILVKSIQKIQITYWMGCGDYPAVEIDGQTLRNNEVEVLSKNDGFDSVEDFFKYFDSDFMGKIIHWTDYSYCG